MFLKFGRFVCFRELRSKLCIFFFECRRCALQSLGFLLKDFRFFFYEFQSLFHYGCAPAFVDKLFDQIDQSHSVRFSRSGA